MLGNNFLSRKITQQVRFKRFQVLVSLPTSGKWEIKSCNQNKNIENGMVIEMNLELSINLNNNLITSAAASSLLGNNFIGRTIA